MRTVIRTLSLVAVFLIPVVIASAAPLAGIEFPIVELDGCADQEACKAFCDDLANKDACLAFARAHGLADERSAAAEKLPPVGPGGCTGESECRAYCDDVSHIEECVAFGETHGLIGRGEAAQARQLVGQTGPGGCRGANECRAYCDDAAHGEECLEFANRQGLISPREFEAARSLKSEGGPGGCRTPEACRQYCEDPAHLEECTDSAVEHGFMNKDEALRIKKQHITQGPGGCSGQDACRAYCGDASHQEECIAFGEENGFMSRDEARKARSLASKPGPGGCRGEECRAYCGDPSHQEECIAFAEQSGMVPAAEIERARKMMKISEEGGPGGCRGEECRTYCEDPARQEECFRFAKERGLVKPEDERQFQVAQKLDETIRQSGGPGGCTDPVACRAYCADAANAEACVAFGVAHGGLSEGEVRTKLKEFSERRLEAGGEFHSADDLRHFEEQTEQRFEEFRELETEFRGAPIGAGFGPPAPGDRRTGDAAGGPGGGGAVGPGGCASPAECIRYCSEHKDECFSPRPDAGSASQAARGPSQDRGGAPLAPPRLRQNLIFEVKQGDLPENFKELPPERREEIFHQRFDAPPGKAPDDRVQREQPGKPPADFGGPRSPEPRSQPNAGDRQFPGKPEAFPGAPGEFPGRGPDASSGEHREFREPAKPPESSDQKPFENKPPLPGTPGEFGPPQTRPMELIRPPEHAPVSPQPERTFTPPAMEIFPPKPPEPFAPPIGNSFSAPPPVMDAPQQPPQESFAPVP
ncbi:MAG: hypothetical protein Q8R35_02270 [bacterium]|nr:hypothetical protein [bacterium]